MEFFRSAIGTMQTLVLLIGGGIGVWGIINLMEGYAGNDPASRSQGMKQLMAGVGIAIVATTLIPALASLF